MAALWNVTVLKVEGAEATLSLRMAHPDAGEFSTAKSFGLRLLYEQAWDLGSQFQYQALGPLGEAIQESNIYDDAWLFSQQAQFIAQFEQTGSRGKAYNETALIAEIQRTLQEKGFTQNALEWEQAFDNAWADYWRNSPELPTATFCITATDPKWVQHLKVGQRWRSAAYT